MQLYTNTKMAEAKQTRRTKQRAKKALAIQSLQKSLDKSRIELRISEQKRQFYKWYYHSTPFYLSLLIFTL